MPPSPTGSEAEHLFPGHTRHMHKHICTMYACIHTYMYTYNGLHRSTLRHIDNSHTDSADSNGFILLPSLSEEVGGLSVYVNIYNVDAPSAGLLCPVGLVAVSGAQSAHLLASVHSNPWGYSPALVDGTNAPTPAHTDKEPSGTALVPSRHPAPHPLWSHS